MKFLDKEVEKYLKAEQKRQLKCIDLIPSENYASADVMKAAGSVLTNKYSEGYPGKRYYSGQKWIDKIELLAQKRALKLFGLSPSSWGVNVQPYSGSSANLAVFFALLNFGDTLMGMTLDQGGHLTHGHKVNFSGKAYKIAPYGVSKKTELLDYDEIASLAKRHAPKIIISGATAYPRKINFKKFGEIARSVKAVHMADISHIAGLVAGKAHPSPFSYCDIVTTTTHKTLRGPRGAIIFARKKYLPKINKAIFPGLQGGPHNHITAAKAICFASAAKKNFQHYARQIVKNAAVLARELARKNFRLVSGGTDNHLLLIDLTDKKISGALAQKVLEAACINVNKNTVPYDPLPPSNPSGVRLGTPAVTTRGMKEKEMTKIADLIAETLAAIKPSRMSAVKNNKKFNINLEAQVDKKAIAKIRRKTQALAVKFPPPTKS